LYPKYQETHYTKNQKIRVNPLDSVDNKSKKRLFRFFENMFHKKQTAYYKKAIVRGPPHRESLHTMMKTQYHQKQQEAQGFD